MLRSVAPLAAYKAASQSIASSTTLQNDSALFVPVVANAAYIFEMVISYTGGAQGVSDIKVQWVGPSGTTMLWTPAYINTSGTGVASGTNGIAALVMAGSNGAGNGRAVTGSGTVNVGGTAGNFGLQWAQNSSSGTP